MAAAVDYNKLETPDPIPLAVRGSWDESAKECKNENSTTRLVVGANWVAFYEAYGLMQISTGAGLPDTDESLSVRFAMSGEGSTWDNELVFAWNKAKTNELILVEAKSPENMDRERTRERYVRCVGL
jgi:hypothetical protein